MPKTTVFDIINRKSSGEPAKGRGNKKGGGRRFSYSHESEEQLVQWVLEMRDLHLPISVVQVKEKARQMTQPQVSTFKAIGGCTSSFDVITSHSSQNITVTEVACWIRR